MKREVWFKEDLGQVLLAVGEANQSACQLMFSSGPGAEEGSEGQASDPMSLMEAYQAGFQAALNSLALAFGLLDVAGSLPRTWVGVVKEKPPETVWPRVLGPGEATYSGDGDSARVQRRVTRSWLED